MWFSKDTENAFLPSISPPLHFQFFKIAVVRLCSTLCKSKILEDAFSNILKTVSSMKQVQDPRNCYADIKSVAKEVTSPGWGYVSCEVCFVKTRRGKKMAKSELP